MFGRRPLSIIKTHSFLVSCHRPPFAGRRALKFHHTYTLNTTLCCANKNGFIQQSPQGLFQLSARDSPQPITDNQLWMERKTAAVFSVKVGLGNVDCSFQVNLVIFQTVLNKLDGYRDVLNQTKF